MAAPKLSPAAVYSEPEVANPKVAVRPDLPGDIFPESTEKLMFLALSDPRWTGELWTGFSKAPAFRAT